MKTGSEMSSKYDTLYWWECQRCGISRHIGPGPDDAEGGFIVTGCLVCSAVTRHEYVEERQVIR